MEAPTFRAMCFCVLPFHTKPGRGCVWNVGEEHWERLWRATGITFTFGWEETRAGQERAARDKTNGDSLSISKTLTTHCLSLRQPVLMLTNYDFYQKKSETECPGWQLYDSTFPVPHDGIKKTPNDQQLAAWWLDPFPAPHAETFMYRMKNHHSVKDINFVLLMASWFEMQLWYSL